MEKIKKEKGDWASKLVKKFTKDKSYSDKNEEVNLRVIKEILKKI